jgi:hypothetical protein
MYLNDFFIEPQKPQTPRLTAFFAVRNSIKSHSNTLKSNVVFAVFGLDWFVLRFYFWIGSDTTTPS